MESKIRKKIFVGLVLAIIASIVYNASALAFYNDNLTSLYYYGDVVYNYDANDPDEIGGEDHAAYVDHPAVLIFAGDADKTTVKNGFSDDGFIYTGSTIYNELNDGSGWDPDTDEGMKTDQSDTSGMHYRLYAANGDHMYNSSWGDWILVTAHCDYFPYRGWHNDVEAWIWYIADEDNGWDVYVDELYFYNYDDGWWWGQICYYDCDGWTTFIEVP